MKLGTAVLASLALFAGSAVADDTGFYAGAGLGWGEYSLPQSRITNQLAGLYSAVGAPLQSWSSRTDDTTIPWSVFVGYQIMDYLAVEAGYLDAGSAGYKGSGVAYVVADDLLVDTKAELNWHATGGVVSVIGIWPIDPTWSGPRIRRYSAQRCRRAPSPPSSAASSNCSRSSPASRRRCSSCMAAPTA